MPTDFSSASAVRSDSSLDMSRWWRSDSVIWAPTRITGLSEVIGSWNTIAISVPQIERIVSARAPVMSRSS